MDTSATDDVPVEEEEVRVEGMTAQERLEALWTRIQSSPGRPPQYPDFQSLVGALQGIDYRTLLDRTEDVHRPGHEKVFCSAGGAVALVRMDWRPCARERFTGMFRAADFGLVRCSSVTEPQTPSPWSPYPALVPMVALKFFREGAAPSANIVLAHKKTGHRDANFLAHAVSNHFTENLVYPFKAALHVFQKYSDFPTFTGLSEFASTDQEGREAVKPVAPYALVLLAPEGLRRRRVSAARPVFDQLAPLAAGDVLFEVYAAPEPVPSGRARRSSPSLWRLGDLRLTTPFVASAFADSKLVFRHHLFEADLNLRPEWKSRVDKLAGAPFYEERINAGDVWDPPIKEGSSVPEETPQKQRKHATQEHCQDKVGDTSTPAPVAVDPNCIEKESRAGAANEAILPNASGFPVFLGAALTT